MSTSPVPLPALPENGPRLALAPPPAAPSAGTDAPAPELLRLAAVAESLLEDGGDPPALAPAHLRRRVAAVGNLLRDAAEAVAAADAHVAAARSEAARIAARADDEVARLWRAVSADVAERRSATDAFVARAGERAEREAESVLADASARADALLARADDLVAAWLDEANAEVARMLEGAPKAAEGPVLAAADAPPPRRRLLARLFRRG